MNGKFLGAAALLLALSAGAAAAQNDAGAWRGGRTAPGGQGQPPGQPPPAAAPQAPAPPQAPSPGGPHGAWGGHPGGPPPGWRHQDHPDGPAAGGPPPQAPPGSGGYGERHDQDRRRPPGAPPPQGPAGPQTWNRGPGDRWRQEGGGPDRWHDHGPPQGGPHWTPHRYPPIYRSPERFRAWAWEPPAGWYARSWRYGERLPRAWLTPDDFIDDWWDFGLPEAPPGYAWIRIGGDALLIDAYDGRIVQVVQDVFW